MNNNLTSLSPELQIKLYEKFYSNTPQIYDKVLNVLYNIFLFIEEYYFKIGTLFNSIFINTNYYKYGLISYSGINDDNCLDLSYISYRLLLGDKGFQIDTRGNKISNMSRDIYAYEYNEDLYWKLKEDILDKKKIVEIIILNHNFFKP